MATTSSPGPLATIAAYGPDDTRATKLVVAVFANSTDREPTTLRTWTGADGDLRNHPDTAKEIAQFLKSHQVRQAISPDHIIRCAHEEGVDYPVGGSCPHCPFWANRPPRPQPNLPPGTPVAQPLLTAPKIGRNDPCPCGSGQKYKKCCGKSGGA